MNTKHTLGPWRVGDAGMTVFGPPNGNPSPETIANCRRSGNAAFIVRACNSHHDLVAALRDAYAHVTLLGSGEQPPLSNAEMCNVLGDALAKATATK